MVEPEVDWRKNIELEEEKGRQDEGEAKREAASVCGDVGPLNISCTGEKRVGGREVG
jgi:hypothetical protein